MTTMGHEADRLAARQREHERKVAQKKILLHDCIGFCIVTLTDKDIPDDVARRTTLDALKIGMSA